MSDFTLHDQDGVLDPETFLTIHGALSRATHSPLWQTRPWFITGPNGRRAASQIGPTQ